MVDHGGVVAEPEDHGMVVVGPYVVAEARGDQGVVEAPGEVVGQAPERQQTWGFWWVFVWKTNMGQRK